MSWFLIQQRNLNSDDESEECVYSRLLMLGKTKPTWEMEIIKRHQGQDWEAFLLRSSMLGSLN